MTVFPIPPCNLVFGLWLLVLISIQRVIPFDHCGLVHINGDDKVESVVITKLLGILLALYPGSFPLPVQAWV